MAQATSRPYRSFLAALLSAALLAACSSTAERPKPANLPPVASLIGTKLVWSAQVGRVPGQAVPTVAAGRLFVAGADNQVFSIDAGTGRELWRLRLDAPATTGVGSDGDTAAVVTTRNDLVAIDNGRELWRVRLPARAFSTPLVAGKRVFVLTGERTVLAYDGRTGARLWSQQRPGEPLVLQQPGVLTAVGDTLVAGLSGRLTGLNPLNGSFRWEATVATSRGTNEVERLVDIVAPFSRQGSNLCVRAYGAAVGCVDADRGTLVWTRVASGPAGVHGDADLVFGADGDGVMRAWRRSNGEPAWTNDRLKWRDLGAPQALGRVVAFGDSSGLVHLVSREDGSEMTRLSTDGSPIVGAPLLAGPSLIVQTRNGGIYAWQPQ